MVAGHLALVEQAQLGHLAAAALGGVGTALVEGAASGGFSGFGSSPWMRIFGFVGSGWIAGVAESSARV